MCIALKEALSNKGHSYKEPQWNYCEYSKREITTRLITRTKCVIKKRINHARRHSNHKIESQYFTREIAQLAASVIGFNKKLHTRPGQKVNYLNALSGAFDKVSHERDLSPASYYSAETNADVRGEKHSSVRKIFRCCVARWQKHFSFAPSHFAKFCTWSNYR